MPWTTLHFVNLANLEVQDEPSRYYQLAFNGMPPRDSIIIQVYKGFGAKF